MFQNMQGLDYLIVEPACEVNEKGTREKNDGNEKTSMGDNEKIEVHLLNLIRTRCQSG